MADNGRMHWVTPRVFGKSHPVGGERDPSTPLGMTNGVAGDAWWVFGSPVSDGKKIFCADKEGMVSVIAASDKFELLGQNDLAEVCRSTPAIDGEMMYVRTFGHLYAIRGK